MVIYEGAHYSQDKSINECPLKRHAFLLNAIITIHNYVLLVVHWNKTKSFNKSCNHKFTTYLQLELLVDMYWSMFNRLVSSPECDVLTHFFYIQIFSEADTNRSLNSLCGYSASIQMFPVSTYQLSFLSLLDIWSN